MAGYAARQSTYTTGDVITAADSNDEFDTLLSAFDSTSGHAHDGTAGEGARIAVTDTTGGTQYGIPVLNGAGSQVTSTAAFTGGQLLVGQAAAVPTPKTLSGDATLAASGALTLANTAVTAASYGSATASPTFTVDSKGRLTAAADVTITPAFASITSTPTTLAGYGITDAQGLDATLTSLAALGTAADKIAYTTGIDTWAETALTSFGRSLIDDADAGTARATLGLVIGTNVQAYDATLASIAALGTAADKIAYTTGIDTWAEAAITTFGRSLIDDADAATARTTLGLVIGTDVQAYDADTLKADTTDSLSVGFTQASYSIGNSGSGTVTPLISNGVIQHMTVTGAFTLAAPTDTDEGYIEIEATNDGTGGYSPDLTTNFANVSGTYVDTASAVNLFRISKHNTNTYLEITQEA